MLTATQQLPADHDQRRLALDPTRSFIVQAPAGSGKTELLIQRYLTLLARVAEPESVLAITFTRKAAAEMRARVLDALRAADTDLARAVAKQDHSRNWQLASNHTRLRIQTIDALCLSITSRMPWLSRFGAMPDIAEQADDYYTEAARQTVQLLDGEDHFARAARRLLMHLDNNFGRAASMIAGMIERRDQWLRHLAQIPDRASWRHSMERSLARLSTLCLNRLREAFPLHLLQETLHLARLPEALSSLDDWRAVADLLLVNNHRNWRKSINVKQGFPPSRKREKGDALRA